MELQQRFKAQAGNAIFLDEEQMEKYLRARRWLTREENLSQLEKPGEGNMNFVLRARSPQRSLIIKQARPWVEKYPQIDAPLERIEVEAKFYGLIQQDEVLRFLTPRRLDWDAENYVLILEDLGEGADFLYIYQKSKNITRGELEILVHFLSHLHHRPFSLAERASFPSNQALKQLNHEHIFNFPYLEDNGFDLNTIQAGLQELAMSYKTDQGLKGKIRELGGRYLDTGSRLIHGDYYPGSWLKVEDGVKVIDPEFGYFGLVEFDLGIMIAHLQMAQTPQADVEWVIDNYEYPAGFDEDLRSAFTGVEIMRRIIGLAQLPLDLSLAEKELLMEEARRLIEAWRPV